MPREPRTRQEADDAMPPKPALADPAAMPQALQHALDALVPAVAMWLREQSATLATLVRAVRVLEMRVGSIEATIESQLYEETANGHTLEPLETVGDLRQRIATLETCLTALTQHATVPALHDDPPTLEARLTALAPHEIVPALHDDPPAPTTRRIQSVAAIAQRTPLERTTEDIDAVRMELLQINRERGEQSRRRRMRELQDELGLEKKQIEGIWAHCNGKLRPGFIARRFRTTPKKNRVALRDTLAHYYRATSQDVIKWSLAGGFGSGNHTADNPA